MGIANITRTPTINDPVQVSSTVPRCGPAWCGAVMGTAILSTLLQTYATRISYAHEAALVLWGLGWLILLGVSGGFAADVVRDPGTLTASIRDETVAPFWGMVSMGILSAGASTATVIPTWWVSLAGVAWRIDLALWVIGSVIGVAIAVSFARRLAAGDRRTPTPVWGLAMVGPMVSSTVGAGLVGHVEGRAAAVILLAVSAGCFVLALVLGVLVFARVYHHHWSGAPVPLAATASVWIPLGIVGQSTAAAQVWAVQSAAIVPGEVAGQLRDTAHVYGVVVLLVGVPLAAWALALTVRGMVRRMPFSPGWWAMTFPIGTLSLGAHHLGAGIGMRSLTTIGLILCAVLCCTWTLCAAASLRAVRLHLMSAQRVARW